MSESMKDKELLSKLGEVIQGLGKHFGSNCEFVIHDYANKFEKTIISIVNGEVTGRQIGDCATSVGLKLYNGEALRDDQYDGVFNYLSQTKDGRILRSSTIYLRDDEGHIIGSLCINNDITDLQQAVVSISNVMNLSEIKKEEKEQKVFVGKIDDLLRSMITDSINSIGVPVSQMTKKQKKEGIRILKKQGAFKIQRAVDVVAQYYGVSKFTVYNYVNEIESEIQENE